MASTQEDYPEATNVIYDTDEIIRRAVETFYSLKLGCDVCADAEGPSMFVIPGLWSYDEAFQKEYFTLKNPRVKNIRSVSVRNQGLNSLVERLHGSIRDREKTMRGMQKKESAQKIAEAMRIHYNYCREHSTLGKTPAEKAGVQLNLEWNKIERLIRLSSSSRG